MGFGCRAAEPEQHDLAVALRRDVEALRGGERCQPRVLMRPLRINQQPRVGAEGDVEEVLLYVLELALQALGNLLPVGRDREGVLEERRRPSRRAVLLEAGCHLRGARPCGWRT